MNGPSSLIKSEENDPHHSKPKDEENLYIDI